MTLRKLTYVTGLVCTTSFIERLDDRRKPTQHLRRVNGVALASEQTLAAG